MGFRGLVWSVLVWNRVRIWRTGWHTPTKNCQEYPPPGQGVQSRFFSGPYKTRRLFWESGCPVGSDFFTIHKMFQKKNNNKKPLYSSLSLIELAIFPPFPLAYSSDIANVSKGVRLESWWRSGEKRTLLHSLPPRTLFLFCSRSNFRATNRAKKLATQTTLPQTKTSFHRFFFIKKKKFPVLKVTVPCLSRH